MSRFARRLQYSTATTSSGSNIWPNATNTGVPAGTVLTTYPSTTMVVTTDNSIVENIDINGYIEVRANNVTIRNCKIHNNGTDTGVQINGGSATIEDCEIYGWENAVAWGSYTVRRCNIHSNTGDGFKWGSDTLIEDNYVHDFAPGNGAHTDGLQMSDPSTNATLRHNWIEIPWNGPGNGTVFIQLEGGGDGVGPILIDNNYLNGGGFTVYLNNKGTGNQGGITVQNNVIGPNHEYWTNLVSMSGVTWTGNVDNQGQPVGMSN